MEISIGTFFKDFTERRQRTSYSETETETAKFVGMLFSDDASEVRYDTRCYFNVRSKADISREDLQKRKDLSLE